MNRHTLLQRLMEGSVTNVAFQDLCQLVEGLGFELARVQGSHHIYKQAGVREVVNLQNENGKAKPYQVRQVLKIVNEYNLVLEG